MKKTYNFIAGLALFTIMLTSRKKDNVKSEETVFYETDFSTDDEKWDIGYSAGDTYFGYENGVYVVKGSATTAITSRVMEVFSAGAGSFYVEAVLRMFTDRGNRVQWQTREP